jgi:beta-glucanase (GH16 family)
MRQIIAFCMLLGLISAAFADPPPGYSLFWSDEFNGTTLDTNTWYYDTGSFWSFGAQYQIYTNQNLTVENGAAVLWVRHEKRGYSNYTSCQIKTKGKKEFKYGYIEVRLKAPYGNGPQPGFWMEGANNPPVPWPECGVVSIYYQRTGVRGLNYNTGDSSYIADCEYAGATGGPIYNTIRYNHTDCLCNNYHLYAIEWDSLGIKYLFDGNQIGEFDSINASYNFSTFHQPYYFIVNIPVFPSFAPLDTAIFPQKMYIDYVRVYQKGIVGTVNRDGKQQTLHSFSLVKPSTALLKVYDLSGKLVADYSGQVRRMKPGDNVMKLFHSTLSNGAYVVRHTDNGVSVARMLVRER